MNSHEVLPRALRIVALLFLLSGTNSLLTILVCAVNNRLQLDSGIVGIFVFFGLRHLSPGWRTCALVLLLFNILIMPILAILGCFAPEGHLELFGQPVASVPPILVSFACLGWLALSVWEWRVLRRPEVFSLFTPARSN